jgi:hypothetical protein
MSGTTLKLGIGVLVVAGAVTAFIVQHQTEIKLRGENDSLREQVAQFQTDNESLSNHLAATKVAVPDGQQRELVSLRGEVGVLRQKLKDQGRLQEENRRLQARVAQGAAPVAPPAQIAPEDQFTLQSVHVQTAMKQVGLAMMIYAGDHQDQFPTNFTQITDELGGQTNFPGNIPLNAIEFVNMGQTSKQYPQMITLRQRDPIQRPDGTWERFYGLADGSVQTQVSNDGNFDAYEKQQQQFGPPPSQ